MQKELIETVQGKGNSDFPDQECQDRMLDPHQIQAHSLYAQDA